jgi:hypothetical protein
MEFAAQFHEAPGHAPVVAGSLKWRDNLRASLVPDGGTAFADVCSDEVISRLICSLIRYRGDSPGLRWSVSRRIRVISCAKITKILNLVPEAVCRCPGGHADLGDGPGRRLPVW